MPKRTSAARVVIGRMAFLLLASAAVASALVFTGAVSVPNRWNPFAPLRVADDPNWLTRYKLTRLERNPHQCVEALAQSPVSHKAVQDRSVAGGCGLENSFEVTGTSVEFNRPFTATCPLVVAWSLFELHVLRPAARVHLGQDVTGVTHLGTYACRNINNRAEGRRSEHAQANAIDVAGFTLSDGSRITISQDWAGSEKHKIDFLRAVRDGACEYFDVVLGPDYNSAHHDHFHLDMGSFRACR